MKIPFNRIQWVGVAVGVWLLLIEPRPLWAEEGAVTAAAPPATATAVTTAEFYRLAQEGQFSAAAVVAQQLLPQIQQQFGANHPDTLAFTLQSIQIALLANGQLTEAERALLPPLLATLEPQPPLEPLYIEALQFAADLDYQLGGEDRGLALYQKLLQRLQNHPDQFELLLTNLWRASELLAAQRSPVEALNHWQKLCDTTAEPQRPSCLLEAGRWLLEQRALTLLPDLLLSLEKRSLTAGDRQRLQLLQGRYARSQNELEQGLAILATLTEGQPPLSSEPILNGYLERLELLLLRGQIEAADRLVKPLLEIDQHLPEALAHWQARLSDNLGQYYQQRGELELAESYYRAAYERYTAEQGGSAEATLASRNNLALLLEGSGYYDQAEPLLAEGLLLAQQELGAAHPTTLALLNNLALLQESQGKFDKAAELQQRGITLLSETRGDEDNETLIRINNLAYVHMKDGRYRLAADLFAQIHQKWQSQQGEFHQNTLKVLNNWGRALLADGKLPQAEQKLALALEGRRRVFGENHIDTLRSKIDWIRLELQKPNRNRQAEAATQLLKQCEQKLGAQHPYCFEALGLLIDAQVAAGAMDAADQLHWLRYQRRNEFLERMLWVTSENSREGYIRLHRPELESLLDFLTTHRADTAAEKMLAISLERKGLLLAISAQIQQAARFSDDPALKPVVDRLQQARKHLASLTLSGPQGMSDEQHLQLLEQLDVEIQRLEAEIGSQSHLWAQRANRPSLDSLWANLPVRGAVVDYTVYRNAQGEEQVVATVLRKEEGGAVQSQWVNLGSYSVLSKAVINFRTLIQDVDAYDEETLEIGSHLYAVIWKPLLPLLGEADKLFIVPDGTLNILPFAAVNSPKGEYLVQRYTLHLLTSLRDLLPKRERPAQQEMVILAGPDYNAGRDLTEAQVAEQRQQRNRSIAQRGTSRGAAMVEMSRSVMRSLRGVSRGMRGLQFSQLPGAETEGKLINAQFSGVANRTVTLFTGGEASEGQLRKLPHSPQILHLATHGFFLKADEELRQRIVGAQRGLEVAVTPPPGDNPLLRSGLAFAGINHNAPYLGEVDTDNDGILTALEVLNLPLQETRLAVLSACETGLGEIHEGEGVYGLRRSFLEAGAEALVTSLWEVSDAGTQALMSRFYELIFSGLGVHEAFRQTQLEMISSYRWGYPFIWSAFMLVGR